MKKLSVASSALAGIATLGALYASPAAAEVSMNVAAVSNYYFRGVTQTLDGAAVQGGIDYEDASGFYVGAWSSNVDFGDGTSHEIDFYAGFAGDAGGVGYDVGYLYYAYPDAPEDIDFAEVYGELSYEAFAVGVAVTANSDNDDGLFDTGDVYTYLSAGFPLSESISLGATAGFYAFTNDGDPGVGDADYFHFAAGIEKDAGDFGAVSLNAEFADIEQDEALGTVNSDDLKFWVGWSKSF